MHIVDQLTKRKKEYDFSASGQGHPVYTQLISGELQLINMLEMVDWGPSPYQVEVCENCGVAGCEPGGYLQMKRSGEFLLWFPAFEERNKGEFERNQYRTPTYINDSGPILIDAEVWNRNVEDIRWALLSEEFDPLHGTDVRNIFQWQAPGGVLGEPGEDISVRDDLIHASQPYQTEEALTLLQETLRNLPENTVSLEQVQDPDEFVELYVGKGSSWRPIVLKDEPHLYLGNQIVVREEHRS